MQRVVAHLNEERLPSLLASLHEIHRSRPHPKDVHRIGRQMRRSVLIACCSIAFIIAMRLRPTSLQMPFAIVRGRVARRLQNLPDRHLVIANALPILAFNQTMPLLSRRGLRPPQRRRIPPRLQADARRRAHRRRRIRRAESHALLGEPRDVRRLHEAAFRVRHVWVHLAGQPAPGLIVREHEKNVRRRGSKGV